MKVVIYMKLCEVDKTKLAPMMQHYVSIKENNPDTIINVHKFIPVTLETGIANIATPTPNQPTCVIETKPDKRYDPFCPNEYLASK